MTASRATPGATVCAAGLGLTQGAETRTAVPELSDARGSAGLDQLLAADLVTSTTPLALHADHDQNHGTAVEGSGRPLRWHRAGHCYASRTRRTRHVLPVSALLELLSTPIHELCGCVRPAAWRAAVAAHGGELSTGDEEALTWLAETEAAAAGRNLLRPEHTRALMAAARRMPPTLPSSTPLGEPPLYPNGTAHPALSAAVAARLPRIVHTLRAAQHDDRWRHAALTDLASTTVHADPTAGGPRPPAVALDAARAWLADPAPAHMSAVWRILTADRVWLRVPGGPVSPGHCSPSRPPDDLRTVLDVDATLEYALVPTIEHRGLPRSAHTRRTFCFTVCPDAPPPGFPHVPTPPPPHPGQEPGQEPGLEPGLGGRAGWLDADAVAHADRSARARTGTIQAAASHRWASSADSDTEGPLTPGTPSVAGPDAGQDIARVAAALAHLT